MWALVNSGYSYCFLLRPLVDTCTNQRVSKIPTIWFCSRRPPRKLEMFVANQSPASVFRAYNVMRGSFYYHGLTLIPALIDNLIHYKVWMKLLIYLQTTNGCTFEVWEWISYFMPRFTSDILLHIHEKLLFESILYIDYIEWITVSGLVPKWWPNNICLEHQRGHQTVLISASEEWVGLSTTIGMKVRDRRWSAAASCCKISRWL